MYENRINLSIKPNFKTTETQSAQIVTIGNYSYNPYDTIGLGYISNVYLGQNTNTHQKVAIKVINTTNKDQLVQQFLQSQIQILQKIKTYGCKHLLKLEETFRIDNKLYIVTQFCEGKDLAKVLRQEKLFSDKEAQTIMKQVIKTYEDLYDLGIVHRDLKLSNLLVKNGHIKLADFGFAVPIVNCIEEFPYNAGSPYYMPPESLKRNRFSFKSDIWALGVMAYELIFGKLPYRQKVQSLQYDALMQKDIQEMLSGTNLSQTFRTFITACMEKDMRKRATPEYVISYIWPQAELQLPKCFTKPQLSQNQTVHLPQGIQNYLVAQTPKFNRQLTIEDHLYVTTDKFTPSSSLLQTQRPKISKIDHNKSKIQSQISFRNFPSTQPLFIEESIPRQKILIRSEKSMVEIPTSPIVFPKTQRTLSYNVDISGQFKRNEAVVACILHYCRFLFNVYTILEKDTNVPDQNLLRVEIAKKILNNYHQIGNFLSGKLSKFGFMTMLKEFSQTEQYHKIKQIVRAHTDFFSIKFNVIGESLPYNPFLLSNTIKYLIRRIPSRFNLTEQLCHYYYLRNLQQKSIVSFIAHSQIQNLVKSMSKTKVITDADCKQLESWVSQLVR